MNDTQPRYYVTGSESGPWYIRENGQIMGHCGIERDARLIADALNAYHATAAQPRYLSEALNSGEGVYRP